MDRRSFLASTGATVALGGSAGIAQAAFAADRDGDRIPVRIDRRRIDQVLARMIASGRAAGVSALIWQDGAERYFGAAGYADREAQRPMGRNTIVQLFSMTKPVTAVAAMQLWEAGRFRLDDPLSKHLPEFADMRVVVRGSVAGEPATRPPSRAISIRDVMRHTAGFSYGLRDTLADDAYRAVRPLSLDNDLNQMGAKLAKLPLLFDPGTEWSYSAAADLQALLIERLAGVPFESCVRDRILLPLGMKDTAWSQPAANLPRLAATYLRRPDETLARQDDAVTRSRNFAPRKLTSGGSGLASSIDDYMRFARMMLGSGALDGVRVLAPATVRLMTSDQLDPAMTERFFLPTRGAVGYGFGVAVRTARAQSPAENRGTVGEFFWDGYQSTLFWVDPANRLAAVFFAQTSPVDTTLHHDFREAVYGPAYLGPVAS